jgi:hypothetical protein
MKLKEAICHGIDGLDNEALMLLYLQIQTLQRAKTPPQRTACGLSIDEVLRLTSSSAGSWGDSLIGERAERA